MVAAEAIIVAIETRRKNWRPLAESPKWVGLMRHTGVIECTSTGRVRSDRPSLLRIVRRFPVPVLSNSRIENHATCRTGTRSHFQNNAYEKRSLV
jgi:hypothetical protein